MNPYIGSIKDVQMSIYHELSNFEASPNIVHGGNGARYELCISEGFCLHNLYEYLKLNIVEWIYIALT